jgi:hypothetical protein
MPPLTVWTVRTAFLYLVAGFTLGAALMSSTVVNLPGWTHLLRPLHVELLLIGWLVQFAIGVAFWILPRFGRQRGNVTLAVSTVILLNAGIWLLAMGQILWPTVDILPAAGRTCEALAALLFGFHVWTRIKPARTHSSH